MVGNGIRDVCVEWLAPRTIIEWQVNKMQFLSVNPIAEIEKFGSANKEKQENRNSEENKQKHFHVPQNALQICIRAEKIFVFSKKLKLNFDHRVFYCFFHPSTVTPTFVIE